MAQAAYQGHATWSSSKAANTPILADTVVAPADRGDYVPGNYSAQPGAAARANGYPRVDGK